MTRSGLLRERYHVTNHNVNHFYNGVSIAPRGDQDFLRRETDCAFTLGFEILYLCAVLGDIFSLFLADLCDGFGFWANFTCCL